MQKALTAKALEALKPAAKRYEVHDLHCPGLSVRVSANGHHKIYSVKFRFGLKQKRMKLGVHPRISLATAREKAIDILRQVDEGIDPTKRRRNPDTKVEAVCREFVRLHARQNRCFRETERILQREFVGTFAQRDIRDIKRWDVLELIDAAIARGSTYQANRILSNIRKLFNWCIERGIVDTSPIRGLKAPTKELSRDRVLEDDEIVRLLRACRNDVYPFRQFVPMLLATGARRGELALMQWHDVDLEGKIWVIPADRSKNGKPHVVPLSAFALDILSEIPRFLDCDYVFTTTHRSPVSGFSKMLRRLSEGSQTSGWRLHDLRRTAASGMARAGVAPHVVEKVLNHVSGKISGIAAVYNRYGYNPEKVAALEDWGSHLTKLSSLT